VLSFKSWKLNNNVLISFCKVWIWVAWAWSTSLLSTLCSFFLTFLLELCLVAKAWMEGWSALAFGWGTVENVRKFYHGHWSCFHSGNLVK
jgi:hypothetical protein